MECYYKLFKVQNGWLCTVDQARVPDGLDGRGYSMNQCMVFHSLQAFAEYINEKEKPNDSTKRKR